MYITTTAASTHSRYSSSPYLDLRVCSDCIQTVSFTLGGIFVDVYLVHFVSAAGVTRAASLLAFYVQYNITPTNTKYLVPRRSHSSSGGKGVPFLDAFKFYHVWYLRRPCRTLALSTECY